MQINNDHNHVDLKMSTFIGYKDYINSESTKLLAEEKNIKIFSPTLEALNSRENAEEKEEVVEQKEKVNINNIAIIILGWSYLIWTILGSFVSKAVRAPIIQIFNGLTTFDIIIDLLQGRIVAEGLNLVIYIIAIVAFVTSFILIIVSHLNLYKDSDIVLKMVSIFLFICSLFVVIAGGVVEKRVNIGAVITAVISLLIVILSMIKNKNKKREDRNGKRD